MNKYTITEKPKKYKREFNVYKVINDVDEKVYIGSTTTELWHRMSQHRNDARKGEKSPLYNLMREYGIEHFKIVLIKKSDENNIRLDEENEIKKIDKSFLLNHKLNCKKDVSKTFDKEEIINAYKHYKSFNATAKFIGCSRATVKKAVSNLL